MKALALVHTLALVAAFAAALHPGAARLRGYPESTKLISPILRPRAETAVPRAAIDTLKPSDFFVNSSALPLITFPLQNSYAGRLPISSNRDETKEMFFWYWPTSAPGGSNKLTIWLTGGPGCSSLMGFSTENGPIWRQPDTTEPTYNKYNWATVSDMLWIEQPIGTGFDLGTPDITNESQLADQLYGFLQQFYTVFPDLVKKQLYLSGKFHPRYTHCKSKIIRLSGESYSGYYIPYIASRIIHASPSEKKTLLLDLQSFLIVDGVYSSFIGSQQAPVYSFITKYQKYLELNSTTINQIHNATVSCGYQNLMDSITYPPKGKIPLPDGNKDVIPDGCDVWSIYNYAAYDVNPCFSHYKITTQCPYMDPVEQIWFSRADVQEALHVGGFGDWTFCSNGPVFINDTDNSAYSETLFPDLLNHLLKDSHSGTDYSMGFYSARGFQKPITTPLVVGGRQYGVYHTERKLTYIEFDTAGHMIPQDEPAVALHAFKWMLNGGNI